MDPGSLLVGIAAVITAVRGWMKANKAEQEVASLRSQINQMASVNQAPSITVSPVFNVALPPNTQRTLLTEGDAQVGSTQIYEIGPVSTAPALPPAPAPSQPTSTEGSGAPLPTSESGS